MIKLINRHHLLVRGLFYAVTVVLGLRLAAEQLRFGNDREFFVVLALVSLIFAVELYASWQYRKFSDANPDSLFHVSQIDTVEELFLHLLIPLMLFISAAAFLYFNRQPEVQRLVLWLNLPILTLLFINIRAHYTERLDTEIRTHYAYDLAKFIIFFNMADAMAQGMLNFGLLGFWIGGLGLTAVILSVLTGLRFRKLEIRYLVMTIVGAFILSALMGAVVVIYGLNPTKVSLYATLGFYIYIATIYHLMHRNLTWQLAAEYLLVSIVGIITLNNLA
jgi:hypothetical protein